MQYSGQGWTGHTFWGDRLDHRLLFLFFTYSHESATHSFSLVLHGWPYRPTHHPWSLHWHNNIIFFIQPMFSDQTIKYMALIIFLILGWPTHTDCGVRCRLQRNCTKQEEAPSFKCLLWQIHRDVLERLSSDSLKWCWCWLCHAYGEQDREEGVSFKLALRTTFERLANSW